MKKTFILCAAFASLVFGSCSKSDNSGGDQSGKFAGTYILSSNCWSGTNPVTIVTNGTTAIILPLEINSGTACQKYITIPATVSGNTIQTTTVSVADACNNIYSETVSGTLNGSTLTLNYITANSAGSYTCTFAGTKQ